MTLERALLDAWRAALVDEAPLVVLDGVSIPIRRTRAKGLRCVALSVDGRIVDGIEQNPETKSRWAELARGGKRIMQFKIGPRYIGNVCEGVLMRYPAWKSLGLPD